MGYHVVYKTQSVDKTDYPVSEQYGRDNLIPFLNYCDVQNYIKGLRKYLYKLLGYYETLHFYAVGEYGPVHFRPQLSSLIIHKLGPSRTGSTILS